MPLPSKVVKRAILVSIFLSAAAAFSQAQGPTSQIVPRMEKGVCRVPIPAGVKAECIDLIVPESHAKRTSRTIRLPVVIIKSSSATPKPDPVVYTAGGPGAGSLGMVRGAANLVPYTNERDFIIFEQRGTQYAEPSLQCPEVTEALHSSIRLNLNSRDADKAEIAAVRTCRTRLAGMGIDLGAYNSVESAADLNDLRTLLALKEWNLYGLSYSTRLMLNYVRAFPASVRSVILDSVLPPTANWDETGIGHVMGALGRVFRACTADKDCSSRYPHSEDAFYRVVEKLDRHPVSVNAIVDNKTVPVAIAGKDFVDLIYNLLEGANSLTYIPFAIDAVDHDNFEPLKKYAENNLTSGGFIWGMRYSVWCTEEMPFESRRKIASEATKFPRLKGFTIQGSIPDICRVWNVPAAAPVENQPVRADVPVLVFSGEFDPDTPPEWGRLVASWFRNSQFFEVPNASHGAMNRRCTFAVLPIEFLNDPKKPVDPKCLTELPRLVFHIQPPE